MRVLAIDTALEACSVAVLDTERSDLRAHESLPMQRGHAEALMPLVARMLDRVIDTWKANRFARVLAVEHARTHQLPKGDIQRTVGDTSITIYRIDTNADSPNSDR